MNGLDRNIGSLLESIPLAPQWVNSLLLLAAVVCGRLVWLRLRFRQHPEFPIEEKRRLVVVSRNMAFLAAVFGLFLIWAAQIQSFALSMVALAAATVLATKELIMCLSGSLLRAVNKQYSVGDYIEIGHLRGRVVDINMFSTLMMQLGPNPHIGNMSGKTVSFPNSLLLSQTIQRDNILGRYVVHSFDIPVPIRLDSDAIVPRLYTVLDAYCAPYAAEIGRHLEEVQAQKLFITPAVQPRIGRVPHDDKVYILAVRFASPVGKRAEIQQAVLDEFIRVQYRLLNGIGDTPADS